MNTQRPSNERVRPLFNALQFIEPSSAPFHAAATETSPDKSKDFLAVPQQLRGEIGATARTIPKATDLDFLVGTDASANDGLVVRPKTPTENNKISSELQNNLNKKGVQVPKQDAKKSMPSVLSTAETVPLLEEERDKQGDEKSSMQGAMQVEAPVDKPWDSSTIQPPYPRQRDARLKKPVAKQTGPVTDEGKDAVAQNAKKHGGYAMPTRGDEGFASIEQSITGRLEPIGLEQHSLARSISYEVWRISNIERTVVELERDIDQEKVSLSQLAVQVDFPFADCYREVMLAYNSEESLRMRVYGHLCGEFSNTLDSAARNSDKADSYLTGPNARAASLIARGREVLVRPHLIQNLEEEFFEEFDAVILDARLGRSSLHPLGSEQRQAGWALPLVECWVYRNFRQIRVTENRLKASLRLDLMTSPSIERALRGATARLGLLLSDYRDCRPDISPNRLRLLGYGPSRAA